MLLNRFETRLMNNPLRTALQRRFEATELLRMGGLATGARALEVGCGRGVGVEIILDTFGAASVDAFDLDPGMVALARARLARHGDRVRLWIGDVARIDAPDASYDAVFDFGIVHHVPDWRGALAEIHRALKPDGRFYAEEVLRRFILNPLVRRLLDHPLHDRFDHATFAAALGESGLELAGTRNLLDFAGFFVARKGAVEPRAALRAEVKRKPPKTSHGGRQAARPVS